ncbi:hypothetical protein CSKR_102234 [Clonorchis sinensis]|uniref:Uncharacterized protein n=1 Tax=Clonorchis sinensis TaxID=79923 RepID=A0A3R7FL29_CLOSI|nr:hypothetical protein CSKR_102234 [Clonorchis sinensis]
MLVRASFADPTLTCSVMISVLRAIKLILSKQYACKSLRTAKRQNMLDLFRQLRYLQIYLVSTIGSAESLVHNILQMNVLNKGRRMCQLVRYSRDRGTFSQKKLLTRSPRVSIDLISYLIPNWTDFDKYTHLLIGLLLRETHLEPS